MKPDPASLPGSLRTGEAIRNRDRNRDKMRAVTAVAGLASVLAAAGVAYTLPGSAHTATVASRVASGSAHASSSTGTSSTGSGIQGSSAPSASSGSGHVTSGGS